MWLIDTSTLVLHEVNFEQAPPYAILSHRWQTGEETNFQDFQSRDTSSSGYKKIHDFCSIAKQDGHAFAWVDTCCIDRKSSAELSESINSMYAYYNRSSVCYVLLADTTEDWQRDEWWTRGWTLQELLAPETVHFYNRSWQFIGDKISMATDIAATAKLPIVLLTTTPWNFFHWTVAEKMSWAAGRSTTRTEDRAYSLLGLFSINLPLLYGEGVKAFERLQLAILQKYCDTSVFTWQRAQEGKPCNTLATSPEAFKHYPTIGHLGLAEGASYTLDINTLTPPRVTSWGIELMADAHKLWPLSADERDGEDEFDWAIPLTLISVGCIHILPFTLILTRRGPSPWSYQRLRLCPLPLDQALKELVREYEAEPMQRQRKFFLSFDDHVYGTRQDLYSDSASSSSPSTTMSTVE